VAESDPNRINALFAQAARLRRDARTTLLPWYRRKLVSLARDIEAKATELDAGLEAPGRRSGGLRTVRPDDR
jgi:hypothetical protein